MLNLESLEKAFASLKEAYHLSLQEPGNLIIRDSVIQRFEYTYELSWKMMRRGLKEKGFSPDEIKDMYFKDLLRTCAEEKLIDNPMEWVNFREKRNITAHTYDEKKSKEVYDIISSFIISVEFLLNNLQKANS